MTIGDKEISEIIITDENGGLLASITDESVIYYDDYFVTLEERQNELLSYQ